MDFAYLVSIPISSVFCLFVSPTLVPLHAVLVVPSIKDPCLFQAKGWGLTHTWPISLSSWNWNVEYCDTEPRKVQADCFPIAPGKGKSFSSCVLGPHGKLISQECVFLCSHVAWLLNEEFIPRSVTLYVFGDIYAVSSIKHLLERDFHGLFWLEVLGCENFCFLRHWKVKVKCWMCFKFWDNTSRFESWCLCVRAYVCVQNWGGKAASKTLLWKMPKHWATYFYGKDLCVWMKPVSFINIRHREAWLPLPCFWTFVHIKQFPSPWLLNFLLYWNS